MNVQPVLLGATLLLSTDQGQASRAERFRPFRQVWLKERRSASRICAWSRKLTMWGPESLGVAEDPLNGLNCLHRTKRFREQCTRLCRNPAVFAPEVVETAHQDSASVRRTPSYPAPQFVAVHAGHFHIREYG